MHPWMSFIGQMSQHLSHPRSECVKVRVVATVSAVAASVIAAFTVPTATLGATVADVAPAGWIRIASSADKSNGTLVGVAVASTRVRVHVLSVQITMVAMITAGTILVAFANLNHGSFVIAHFSTAL
jgi:hypothetical protein